MSPCLQARTQAEDLLDICLHKEEQLDMDGIWTVVDSYKYAIVITRELDIECEVMALSGSVPCSAHLPYLASSGQGHNLELSKTFRLSIQLIASQPSVVAGNAATCMPGDACLLTAAPLRLPIWSPAAALVVVIRWTSIMRVWRKLRLLQSAFISGDEGLRS